MGGDGIAGGEGGAVGAVGGEDANMQMHGLYTEQEPEDQEV